jgi:hypothetical protein
LGGRSGTNGMTLNIDGVATNFKATTNTFTNNITAPGINTNSIQSNVITSECTLFNNATTGHIRIGESLTDGDIFLGSNATSVSIRDIYNLNTIKAASSSSEVNLFKNVTTGLINIATGQIQNDLYIGTNTGTVGTGNIIIGSDYNTTYLGHNSPNINIGIGGGTGKTINIGTSNTTTKIARSRLDTNSPYVFSSTLTDFYQRFQGGNAPATLNLTMGAYYKIFQFGYTNLNVTVNLPDVSDCIGAVCVIINSAGQNSRSVIVQPLGGGNLIMSPGDGSPNPSYTIAAFNSATFAAGWLNLIGAYGWTVIG